MTDFTHVRGSGPAMARASRLSLATVALPTGVAVTLWFCRALLVQPMGRYFFWNLLLAWLPWVLSAFCAARPRSLLTLLAFTGPWLLLLPNAPYLITDLVHLKERHGVPLSFDVLIFTAFALAGCVLGWSSLRHMHESWATRFSPRVAFVADLTFIALTGFGVYLGRFLRFNSWDVVTDPLSLFSTALDTATEPLALAFSLGFSALFGAGFLLQFQPQPEPAVDPQSARSLWYQNVRNPRHGKGET